MQYYSFVDRLFVALLVLFASTASASGHDDHHKGTHDIKGKFPAVFSFGDSILDTGNNNFKDTMTKCNFPPYGRNFPGGIATGRFSDGKVPSDLIVEALGIKPTLPAYSDPNTKNEDLPTGVCFASGGSGNDNLTADVQGVWKLSEQLRMFKSYIRRLEGVVGRERAHDIISKSLYLFSAGNNDIAIGYGIIQRTSQYDFPTYASQLVQWNSDFIKELYAHGARKIGVLSTLPLGCLPGIKSVAKVFTKDCAYKFNEQAKLFNGELLSSVQSLRAQLPHSRIFFIDFYTPLLDIVQNPQKSRFTNIDRGCCGTGTLELGLSCNRLTPFTCSDTSQYVFWDSGHPTEKAYRIMVSTINSTPLN